MQLFGPGTRRTAPVSDAAMRRLLRALRSAPELDPFRIWLVGSRVQSGNDESDIDIVLSPQVGFSVSDDLIERALWHCRSRGLYASNPACFVDPCFRFGGPTMEVVALPPQSILRGVKLLSPKLRRDVLLGRLEVYRRVGRFSIEYSRRAGDTSYYHKLPRGSFGDLQSPYLRPAIEVAAQRDPCR